MRPGMIMMACLSLLLAGCTTSPTTLTADLSGADAVPDGDPDGSGSASITLDDDEVCWELTASGIETATAAHIHRGAAGESGPVVVALSPPATGSSDGCTDVDSDLVAEILETPSGFYVNVHNDAFPGGAIRGQLSA